MAGKIGLNRTEAARWVSRVTGTKPVLDSAYLAYWESRGLLRKQSPGRRRPASYGVNDLLRVRLIVELRREGAPLQRIGRAVRALAKLAPEVLDYPARWRLAVDARGDVHRITDGNQLLALTNKPGQSGWLFLLDGREYLEGAKRAIAEAAA